MITGEARPVVKNIGDSLLGGTVNDGNAVLLMKILSIGADTALSRIVKLVEDALTKKSPIQSLVDKISGVFVPVVIALSTLTFAIWISLTYAMPNIVPSDSSALGFALT
jgi:Cu+-exporting ATPase